MLVCDGRVSLARAQAAIASDWMTAEKRLASAAGQAAARGWFRGFVHGHCERLLRP